MKVLAQVMYGFCVQIFSPPPPPSVIFHCMMMKKNLGRSFYILAKPRFFTGLATSMKKLWKTCLSWSFHCKNDCWMFSEAHFWVRFFRACIALAHLPCLWVWRVFWIRRSHLVGTRRSWETTIFPGSNAEWLMQCWSTELGLCVGQCHGQVEQCLHF